MKHIIPTTNIVIILSFFIFCYTGCSALDDDAHEVNAASPHAVYLLSVSDNRPAEVTIGWGFYAKNGCDGVRGGTAQPDGHTIYLAIEEIIYTGPNDCADILGLTHGEITVKNLEAGEYIIKGKHDNTELGSFHDQYGNIETELGRFRIEPDTAYSLTVPRHLHFMIDPIALNTDEQKGDTYQVTASMYLEGYYDIGCEPIFKTDVERTQDVINIEAWQVIPKKNCQIILDEYKATAQHERKHINIALGTFSTGSYTAILNGIESTFEVPQPPDHY